MNPLLLAALPVAGAVAVVLLEDYVWPYWRRGRRPAPAPRHVAGPPPPERDELTGWQRMRLQILAEQAPTLPGRAARDGAVLADLLRCHFPDDADVALARLLLVVADYSREEIGARDDAGDEGHFAALGMALDAAVLDLTALERV